VATDARELARERLPKTTFQVVDSKTVESSELLIVLEAARAARQGRSLDEAIQDG
jgi:fatty acid-binding protein DegV